MLHLLLPVSPVVAVAESGTAKPSVEDKADGLRFDAGAFGVAHGRRSSANDEGDLGAAPGLALGLVWRSGSWQAGGEIRGGYLSYTTGFNRRTTLLASAGGLVRWFALDGSTAPYIEGGLELLGLIVDDRWGGGVAARFGAGVELAHNDAHHRFRVGLGVDVPSFPLKEAFEAESLAGTVTPANKPLYVIPVTLDARWTF